MRRLPASSALLAATVLALLVVLAAPARAEVEGEAVAYLHGDVALEGYLARDGAVEGKRPGVLIVHAWRGHSDFVREVARKVAEKGYVAFALDMYGQGVYAESNADAAKLAGRFKNDRPLMRARARAGLQVLSGREDVDASKIVAIGFCFGGTTVLELARDGADLAGVVSFHGGLETPMPAEKGAVKAHVLVLHGGDDPHVPPQELLAFWKEMQDAGAAHEIVIFGGAVHSFTDPDAGTDPSRGAAYNADVARRAWADAYDFFARRFGAEAGGDDDADADQPDDAGETEEAGG